MVDIKDNFENAEILIENDLMDYKNRYFLNQLKLLFQISIFHIKK